MTIFTIGYEGLTVDTFVSLLREYDVDVVVDVRQNPLSRKPGFSKKALARILGLSGLAYVHMVALGCPKSVRNQYKVDGDWPRYTDGFLAYLATQDRAVMELSDLAASSSCALLCFEADFNLCHRSMVAGAVRALSGAQVVHIQSTKVRTKRPESLQMAFV